MIKRKTVIRVTNILTIKENKGQYWEIPYMSIRVLWGQVVISLRS